MKKQTENACFNEIALNDLRKRIDQRTIDASLQLARLADRLGASIKPIPGTSMYMGLDHRPSSTEAIGFVESLSIDISHRLGLRSKPRKDALRAIGAIISDLIKSVSAGEGYCYRSTGSDSFLSGYVGRRAFRRSIEAMESMGLVEAHKGLRHLGEAKGCASRFVPTLLLLSRAADHRIEPLAWSRHFQPLPRSAKVAHPIVLKKASRKAFVEWGPKIGGASMPIDRSSVRYKEKRAEIEFLNAFVSRHTLGNCQHIGFQRIFNNGSTTGAALNEGGRVYSIGGGYQQMPSTERASITINGEPTVEIDISGCQPTIVSALEGKPLDQTRDPYTHPDIPRPVLKAFVAQTMGSNKLPTRWSSQNENEYAEEKLSIISGAYGPPDKTALRKDYPIDKVRRAAIGCIPALTDWDTLSYGWARLHYEESECIIATMVKLAKEHNIVALPVHDSIIVPASAEKTATTVLTESFRLRFGVNPRMKIGRA